MRRLLALISGSLIASVASFAQSCKPFWSPTLVWSTSSVDCPGVDEKREIENAALHGDPEAQAKFGKAQVHSCPGELATKAVELSNKREGASPDTLAHAYFELSELDLALENEQRAAKMAAKDEFIQKTHAEYRAAKENKKLCNDDGPSGIRG